MELQERAAVLLLQLYETHLLDSFMHALWTKTQTSPLEDQYFSCVPYLLGEGQAMQYSFHSRHDADAGAEPAVRPPDNYLREAMVGTLARQDVEFDICLQLQTDPFLMPIENAAVMWPTHCRRACRRLFCASRTRRSIRPSRCCSCASSCQPVPLDPRAPPARQPDRARKRMYYELAQLRQNERLEHYEPTGDEVFPLVQCPLRSSQYSASGFGGALRAPRRQSLLRSQARCALLPAATPRLSVVARYVATLGASGYTFGQVAAAAAADDSCPRQCAGEQLTTRCLRRVHVSMRR